MIGELRGPERSVGLLFRTLTELPRAVLVVVLSLSAVAQPNSWSGTWSATVGNGGRVLGGTWDATSGNDPDTAQGNWTLADRNGATLVEGTWAARKEAKTWRGSWRARAASGRAFSGTWRAQGMTAAHLSDMFEIALTKTVSGTWQTGAAYSGAWSIRAYPRE